MRLLGGDTGRGRKKTTNQMIEILHAISDLIEGQLTEGSLRNWFKENVSSEERIEGVEGPNFYDLEYDKLEDLVHWKDNSGSSHKRRVSTFRKYLSEARNLLFSD